MADLINPAIPHNKTVFCPYPISMRAKALFLGIFLLVGCRQTRIEISTQVDSSGSSHREITVISKDGEELVEHPDFLQWDQPGYSLVQNRTGITRSQGFFSSSTKVPPAFSMQVEGLDGHKGGNFVHFEQRDWVLFTQYIYSEQIRDVIDFDDIKAALDDAAEVLSQLTRQTLDDLFGEGFDDTKLHFKLRNELQPLLREAAFMLWQASQDKDVSEKIDSYVKRFVNLANRFGFSLQSSWVSDWMDHGEESEGYREIRRSIAQWVEAGLAPRKEGERTVLVPNLEVLLFDGLFVQKFEQLAWKRFGSKTLWEEWGSRTWARIFGAFGHEDSVTFVLKVRMPGELWRTNGYLAENSLTMLEMKATEAYPHGAGIHCESLIWNAESTAVLLRNGKYPQSSTALEWANLLGDGPTQDPPGKYVDLLKECVEFQSLKPLEDAADGLKEEFDSNGDAKAERLLNWLRGTTD